VAKCVSSPRLACPVDRDTRMTGRTHFLLFATAAAVKAQKISKALRADTAQLLAKNSILDRSRPRTPAGSDGLFLTGRLVGSSLGRCQYAPAASATIRRRRALRTLLILSRRIPRHWSACLLWHISCRAVAQRESSLSSATKLTAEGLATPHKAHSTAPSGAQCARWNASPHAGNPTTAPAKPLGQTPAT
jgi:hypothetical protein